jgi:hypothetical protein
MKLFEIYLKRIAGRDGRVGEATPGPEAQCSFFTPAISLELHPVQTIIKPCRRASLMESGHPAVNLRANNLKFVWRTL